MDENETIEFPFGAGHLFWTGLALAVLSIVIREIPGTWQIALAGVWTQQAGGLNLTLTTLILIGLYLGPVMLAGSYVLRAIDDHRRLDSAGPSGVPESREPAGAPEQAGFWSAWPPRARAAQLWWTGVLAFVLALLINLFGNTVLYRISLGGVEVFTNYLFPVIQVVFILAPALAVAGILVAALERHCTNSPGKPEAEPGSGDSPKEPHA